MTFAALRNDVERIDSLVAKGFDVNKPEPGGLRPIEYATVGGNFEATTRLIEHGADINVRNSEGRTPLFHIARNGRPDGMARLLLERGADPEIADFFGMTPLLIASARGNANMVGILMEHGVSLEHRDSLGRNALDLALETDHEEIGEILASVGLEVTTFPPLDRPDDAEPLPVEGCGSVVDSIVMGGTYWCGIPYDQFARATGMVFGIERDQFFESSRIQVRDGEVVTDIEPDCSDIRLDLPFPSHGAPLAHTQRVIKDGVRQGSVSFFFDPNRRLLGVRCDAPKAAFVDGYSDMMY